MHQVWLQNGILKKIFTSSHVFCYKSKIKHKLMRSLFLFYRPAENSDRLLSPLGFPRTRPRGRLMISLASLEITDVLRRDGGCNVSN